MHIWNHHNEITIKKIKILLMYANPKKFLKIIQKGSEFNNYHTNYYTEFCMEGNSTISG
jgi:hypothetical protein